MRNNVPELVVDTIVREYSVSKFPTIGTLRKRLQVAGHLEKLAAGSFGTSRARIAHSLSVVRKIMVKNGVIEKYRVRFADLPVHPSDRLNNPNEPDDNSPDEGETGLTKRDTRGQELGDDYVTEPAE